MTTLDNLMATNTIPAQHSIQGMLSSMTDEDSFIPTTISASKQRKADATKILALRMLQGYKPTNHKCTDCNIPLMQSSNSGIVQCVVCVEQLESTTPVDSMSDDDESEIQGSMLDDDRDDNNNHQHHSTKKQNKKSVVSITQEGDIELRQLGTHESLEAKLDITWCTKDGLQNEIVVGESKSSSERSYTSDDVASTSSSVEQLDDSNDTRDSNVVPTLPAFNSINYPHLIKEMETRRINALEQQQQQQTKKKTKGIKGIKLLEAIDELSAASSAKKKQQQQLLLQQQLDRHEQLQQEESEDKENSLQAPELEDTQIPKETASPNNDTTPAKFDSTKIIEDTNNILNDLVSTEGSGDGGTSVADAVSASPSIMSDGYGYSKKSMKKLTYQNAKKDAEESATKYSSSPLTGSQRKRMTINNISSEPQQREDRRKVGGLGVDTHDVSQTLYTTPEVSPTSSPKESVGQHIEKDDFFSEIRRKALLSKVSSTKNKLVGIIQEDGIEGAEDTSVKQQPTWDNVSALESPSSFILPKLNGGIKRPVFGISKVVEEEEVSTVPQSLVKSTKLVGLETTDELHQRLRAANIRQHKQQQLHDEMSPAATITRKKTLWTQPVVPDDEKRELALQSIRKEGVILPFDESTKLSQKILHNMSNTTPKMNNLKTSTDVVTVEECSSDEEVWSKKITQAPSESSSFASLSSSVQLQTKRIAQLEADAQRKHQEAELAATTAREALAGMLKKRNVQQDKEKKEGETIDYSVASASQYSYSLTAKNTVGSKIKVDLQQDVSTKDKMEDDNLSMSSTLSSLDNKTDDKDKPKKKGGSINSEDSSDSNDGGSTIDTNTTTSTYLDKLQRSLDKRIRRHSLRASRREFSTPSPSHHRTPRRRPPSLRAESSDSSTSSSYTFSTYDSMPERRRSRSIERRSYDRRHHRSLSNPRSRRNGDSGRRKVVPSLMLPSLSSSASPSSRCEQHLPLLSPHEQYHPAAPPRPHTIPNHQIQYYSGIGESGYHPPIDPSFGSNMIRQSLLSQRVTSEPVFYQQQPLMAHQPRELHYSADGQFGMPSRGQQYSPSLSSRMATLKLAGLPPNHPYGKTSNDFSQSFTGSYPSGVYMVPPQQQKVRFNTAPLPVYESRNDFPTSRR